MHDSAFKTGQLFLQLYAASRGGKVVEIGSYDVNGGFRSVAPPDIVYIGLDIAEGHGVDIVVRPGEPLPMETGYCDAILASSVFEHDPKFWYTFEEMCRVTSPGGFVYLNVPAGGALHRFPYDCWRFYPDAGLALEQLSAGTAYPVCLVESFTTERIADQWNDFVAVFQRDGGAEPPVERIHKFVNYRNLYTNARHDVLSLEVLPEDMRMSDHWHATSIEWHHKTNIAEAELGRARKEAEAQHHRANIAEAELGNSQREAEAQHHRANIAGVELQTERARREECEETLVKLREELRLEKSRGLGSILWKEILRLAKAANRLRGT
ncbi:methyltransferase domain-containing protein [Sphingomonas vulcanisoli]|uniref:methyltransferase domain-containing protein n=1 Tax=Sphingomonas vulcanisoli TaxID=1658060 RepID=UPI001423BE51|nr:methyltransferase domain-containing protein [Sphingomonas vulcanisoli]